MHSGPILRLTQRARSRLLVDLVEDALAEETYAAALAGLAHGLASDEQGISVSVGGYSDKLCVLLRLVLERLRALSVPSERLRVVKEKASPSPSPSPIPRPAPLRRAPRPVQPQRVRPAEIKGVGAQADPFFVLHSLCSFCPSPDGDLMRRTPRSGRSTPTSTWASRRT